MRRIILVRHALSPYDIVGSEGKFCGRSDPSLSDSGVKEAQLLAEFLHEIPTTQLVASPLARSIETANHIARRGLEVVIDPSLTEIDYGEWEGLSKGEVATRFPVEFQLFTNDPITHYPPGGEKPTDCLARAIDWISRLTAECSIAVTHKTWTRLLLCQLLRIPLKEYRRALDVKIAGVTVLVGDKDDLRLDALNYCATRKRIFGIAR